MAQTDRRSLQQIQQETELMRAGLTETVAELRSSLSETAQDVRERISPASIKAEVTGYVRSRGEQLWEDVTAAARKNPVQAIAVGASLAYPAFRLARAIPVPIWLVGTGLYLAGTKSGAAATQKASEVVGDLADQVVRSARELGDQINTAKESATEQVSRAASAGREQLRRATDKAGTTQAMASEQVRSMADATSASARSGATQIKEQAARAAQAATDTVRDFADKAASAGSAAKESTLGAARSARETASHLGDRASRSLIETIESNPLLVVGVGLLIGGVIASALPRTRLEDRMVGGASSSAKRRVKTAGSRGFEAAQGAAGEAYRRAAEQARAEGLDADGLRERANDLGDRLRHVAEAAVTTAFEPPENNQQEDKQQSNFQGGGHHG